MVEKKEKKEKQNRIVIKLPNDMWMHVPLIGISPIVTHAWSEKAKTELEERGTPAAKKQYEPRIPEEEVRNALYRIPGEENSYGLPLMGFKKGLVQVAKDIPGKEINGRFIMRQIFIDADVGELVRMETKSGWKMREDIVRLPTTGAPQIRWRPQFDDWSVKLRIMFNADILSPESILILLTIAGKLGWGEMRPEKGGTYGRYRICGGVKIERACFDPLVIMNENGR